MGAVAQGRLCGLPGWPLPFSCSPNYVGAGRWGTLKSQFVTPHTQLEHERDEGPTARSPTALALLAQQRQPRARCPCVSRHGCHKLERTWTSMFSGRRGRWKRRLSKERRWRRQRSRGQLRSCGSRRCGGSASVAVSRAGCPNSHRVP
eukprot:352856-Chlamydomonas_euryale.AAC.3